MAAVTTRTTNSPHRSSRMSSPKDAKRNTPLRNEDNKPPTSSLQNSQEARPLSPSRTDNQGENSTSKADADVNAGSNAQSFAPPPPRAAQSNGPDGDYFSQNHSNYTVEPNPFESSFANPAGETPGKHLLPPVTSLTSPSSLLPGGTPGWAGSLRSGPLSPAMLAGPTGGATDYFSSDPHFRGSFPTPNESSLRTGLTPGGGGSMFPAPSPNSQALFASLTSGGATPSTIDFRQTAMNVAAQTKANQFNITSNPTVQQDNSGLQGIESKQFQPQPPPQQTQQDPFGQHDTDAANGLFMLAQNGGRNMNQFAMPPQPQHIQTNSMPHITNHAGIASQDTSPTSKRAPKNSIGSISGSMGTGEFSDSGHSEQAKPATRSRGKKGSTAKSNGKRKAEDAPGKTPASRRSKTSNASIQDDVMMDSDDEANANMDEELGENGKKMTDEEKRKNFLERNRVAALKCRQRKKQWLANLQAKVEIFTTENDSLSQNIAQLREEIVTLKTLLMAHKDCPIAQQQGLTNEPMSSYLGTHAGPGHYANPYGMAMAGPNGLPQGMSMGMQQQGGQQQQMQQRR